MYYIENFEDFVGRNENLLAFCSPKYIPVCITMCLS